MCRTYYIVTDSPSPHKGFPVSPEDRIASLPGTRAGSRFTTKAAADTYTAVSDMASRMGDLIPMTTSHSDPRSPARHADEDAPVVRDHLSERHGAGGREGGDGSGAVRTWPARPAVFGELLTPVEAAQYLRLDETGHTPAAAVRTLRYWRDKGQLRATKFARRVWFRRCELDRFLQVKTES